MNKTYKNLLIVCFLALCILPLAFIFTFEKSLWLDEAALALNVLDKSFLELFQPLQYAQSAPPLFLCLTKILVSIFGLGERVLRFIPFFCGMASIVAFWFLVNEIFVRRVSSEENSANVDINYLKNSYFALICTFIFAFSFSFLYNLIEFKPYTTDILFTILTFLIWLKVLQHEVSIKKEVTFALLLSLFPLFSFGSIFPLCAVLVLSLFKRRIIFSSILIFGLLVEYFFIFSKISSGTRVYEYWIPYFINHNPFKAILITIENIKYYFYPSGLTLLWLVLFVAGWFCLFKNNKKIFWFIALTFIGAYSASFFNFYPLYERLSLFIYPLTIVIVAFSLQPFINKKSIFKRLFVFIIIAILFLGTLLFGYRTFDSNYYKREEIKPLLLKMHSEIKPVDKIFVFKGAHLTYRYYNKIFNFENETFVCPYNMANEACINEIKPFCKTAFNRRGTCYILYSSEIDARVNIKNLQNALMENYLETGRELMFDKNSVLYLISPPKKPAK